MPERPAKEDLAKLPTRYIVAYAVRNALRVMPLYGSASGPLNDENFRRHATSLIRCNEWSLRYCNDELEPDTAAADKTAAAATDAAKTATYAAANAAYAAVYAADAAEADATARGAAAAAAAADDAASRAEAAAYADAVDAVDAVDVGIFRDFDKLKELAGQTNGGRFSIDLSDSGPLGPLWPEGPPTWYIKALSEWESALQNVGLDPHAIQSGVFESSRDVASDSPSDSTNRQNDDPGIKIWLDPGSASPEVLQEVLESLSDLQAAYGGLGLIFDTDEMQLFARQGVPQ